MQIAGLYDDLLAVNRTIPRWRHQMETFPPYWPFVRGIHWSPVDSPHTGQWRGALMFSLMQTWTNLWVNNRDADDLRRHGVVVTSLQLPNIASTAVMQISVTMTCLQDPSNTSSALPSRMWKLGVQLMYSHKREIIKTVCIFYGI